MNNLIWSCFFILFSQSVSAAPTKEMNTAFNALVDLIPYMNSSAEFSEKKNEALILEKLQILQTSFKKAKHENLLKQDVFAPSYKLINEYFEGSVSAFKKGKKDYTQWRLREISSLCIDCHTRMPTSHTPSFKSEHYTIETTKLTNKYDIGLAQLIVRRYIDSRKNFIQEIDSRMKASKEDKITDVFKQVLLIDLKVLQDPQNAKSFLASYISKKNNLPTATKKVLSDWKKGIDDLIQKKILLTGIADEAHMTSFINKELIPLEKKGAYDNVHDIHLLASSGVLSHFLFENPQSKLAPEISFWIGWIEKRLKRENFFSSGDLFLKQCIQRYPSHPMAKKCLKEYEESVEFDFTGSSGSHIPAEVLQELEQLRKLINKT